MLAVRAFSKDLKTFFARDFLGELIEGNFLGRVFLTLAIALFRRNFDGLFVANPKTFELFLYACFNVRVAVNVWKRVHAVGRIENFARVIAESVVSVDDLVGGHWQDNLTGLACATRE